MKKIESSSYDEAKLLWLLGDWESLANLECNLESTADNPVVFKIAALYQLGRCNEAKSSVISLDISQRTVLRNLILSGASNCLAKSYYLLGDEGRSENLFSKAIDLVYENQSSLSLRVTRRVEQLSQIRGYMRWAGFSQYKSINKKRNLFIDCGGYDGCSVIKFLLLNPGYDVITFEANPDLWRYYDKLPTKLVRKAVFNYDGYVNFTVDPVDADGSSVIKEKNVDFYKKIRNEDCPTIDVPCVDLSAFIESMSDDYESIVVKLDIEGAEYAILEKMIEDRSIEFVEKLFAEFHWSKIGMEKAAHDDLIRRIEEFTTVEDWDAQEFSVHKRGEDAISRRSILAGAILN